MSSEAGSTISGFLGVSEGGKLQSEAGALKSLTRPLWGWGSKVRGSHSRAKDLRAGVEGSSLGERWALGKALGPLR